SRRFGARSAARSTGCCARRCRISGKRRCEARPRSGCDRNQWLVSCLTGGVQCHKNTGDLQGENLQKYNIRPCNREKKGNRPETIKNNEKNRRKQSKNNAPGVDCTLVVRHQTRNWLPLQSLRPPLHRQRRPPKRKRPPLRSAERNS